MKTVSVNNKFTNKYPDWFTSKQIDEVTFGEQYVEEHPIKNFEGVLCYANGIVDPDKEKKKIYDIVSPYLMVDVDAKINKLFNVLKYAAKPEKFELDTNTINFKNGSYNVQTEEFDNTLNICLNRLPVKYNPEAEEPITWLKFVNDLLEPDDVLTLQEYLGYCLIPTTKSQKMMILVGKGGEGKSRVGRVLRAILGDNMNTSSIAKLAKDRFARADLEGKLLMLDDDMMMEALRETNILKTLVTIEDKTDLEKKGKQSTQGMIYARLLGFSNGNIQSLYDKSDGFYRRQLILTTKDKPADRIDDPMLGDKLASEVEGIVMWCLEGLSRLLKNNYKFTMSEAALNNIEEAKREDNNLIDFLESDGYIVFEPDGRSTSKALYEAYLEWCKDNIKKPFVEKTFVSGLKSLSPKYGLTYLQKIKINGDKYASGFRGVYPRH